MLITTAFDFPGYETHQDTYELRVSELQPPETIPGARPR